MSYISVRGEQSTTAEIAGLAALMALPTDIASAIVKSGATSFSQVAIGAGTGDVVGPASATADAIALFSGTTGKIIKNSTMQLTSTVFSPVSSDGVALGSGTLMWSDLFLASGGVINFNNGNVTLTHSAGILTLGGTATLALGTNSITMTGSIAATGARVTKGWFTDIESTNAPTVSGSAVYYTGGTDVAVTDGGTGRSTSTTAYALIAAGTTATGAHQTLAAGATTEILVGGGASALPVWTTAQGSGAPVRATSPTLTTPVLGVASATSLATSAASPLLMTNGQLLTVTITSQTTGGATLTIPDFASVSDEFVFKTKAVTMSNKTFVAPALGAATATSINGLIITTTTGTFTLASGKTLTQNATQTFAGVDGKTLTINNSGTLAGGDAFVLAIAAAKTLTVSNSLTLVGTDSTVMTFPSTSATIARTDAANTFTGASTANAWVLTAPTITTSIVPTSNDGAALGSTGNQFSDLFLAEGGVINWDNGDLTLTQTGNLIVLAGGQFSFGANTAYFTETDNGNSSTADTIDWTLSNKQKSTLTGNVTYTFTAPGGPCSLVLKIVQGASAYTVTWPATVHWAGGVAPTITVTNGKVDVITFYWDGTTYFGNYSQNYTA